MGVVRGKLNVKSNEENRVIVHLGILGYLLCFVRSGVSENVSSAGDW